MQIWRRNGGGVKLPQKTNLFTVYFQPLALPFIVLYFFVEEGIFLFCFMLCLYFRVILVCMFIYCHTKMQRLSLISFDLLVRHFLS